MKVNGVFIFRGISEMIFNCVTLILFFAQMYAYEHVLSANENYSNSKFPREIFSCLYSLAKINCSFAKTVTIIFVCCLIFENDTLSNVR